jgi:mevalonate kinase
VRSWSAFAPGKVILLGEHAVVYGHPALAGPLSFGVTASARPSPLCALDIPPRIRGERRSRMERAFARAASAGGRPRIRVSLESDLPVSMGLGSSAALSVACARVLLEAAKRQASAEHVARVALEMEVAFHGRPSGVDHTCSALGSLIRYQKRPAARLGQARVVKSPRPLNVVVALVGERAPTHQTVAALRERIERWPRRYVPLLKQIGELADDGAKGVEEGDLEELGELMNINQGLLSALGLSSGGIDLMVHRLKEAGALGAKLTGAGGDGGAVVGLFLEPELAVVRLSRQGVKCFASRVAGPLAL